MKNLNEIYNIVLEKHMERVRKFVYISPAICSSIQECYDDGKITLQEATFVGEHLNSQRPTRAVHPEFITPMYRLNTVERDYWWNDLDNNHADCTTQRILFLSKMIKITKEEQDKKGIISRILKSLKLKK